MGRMKQLACIVAVFPLVGGACGTGRLSSGHTATQSGSAQVDSVIFATAAAAVAKAPDIDRIWPGFWNPPSFALYRRDTSVFLYTVGAPVAGFQVVRHSRVPPVLRGHLYRHEGSWPGLRGGVLPIDPEAERLAMAVSIGVRPGSQLEFLLHESFHGWQFRQFQYSPDPNVPQSLPDSIRLPQDLQARLDAERSLLILILRAETIEEMRKRVREYLDTRRVRFATSNPLVQRIEQTQEWREGTAEYVGLAGALAVDDSPRSVVRASFEARVSNDARWGNRNASPKLQLRDRAYVSGSVMAFALNELQCHLWRESISAGEFLDSELARCVRPLSAG